VGGGNSSPNGKFLGEKGLRRWASCDFPNSPLLRDLLKVLANNKSAIKMGGMGSLGSFARRALFPPFGFLFHSAP
jgi:hypothetical protein